MAEREETPRPNPAIEWLRGLAARIPESPNRLSILNMARSGADTALNWLDAAGMAMRGEAPRTGFAGTGIGPAETIAPLGLAAMAPLTAVRGGVKRSPRVVSHIENIGPDADHPLGPVRAYHGTTKKFNKFDLGKSRDIGIHFGTKSQAEEILNVRNPDEPSILRRMLRSTGLSSTRPRLIEADINLRNPIEFPDLGQWFARDIVDEMEAQGLPVAKADRDFLIDRGTPRQEQMARLRQILTDAGFDGMRYLNIVEGNGPGWSYATWTPGTVTDPKTGRILFADTARSSLPGTLINADEDKPMRKGYASGGAVTGPLHSDMPGRTDGHPIDVPEGAYVVPADIVSGLGEGNTLAGTEALEGILQAACAAAPRRSIPRPKKARGGPVPIAAAGGEYIVPPEIVERVGGGDIERGHHILDAFVKAVRRDTIKKMASLPDPQG